MLNIQRDAFSTNKSGAAAWTDEVEASRNQDMFRESAQKHQNSPLSGYPMLKQYIYLDSMLHSTITEPGYTGQQFCWLSLSVSTPFNYPPPPWLLWRQPSVTFVVQSCYFWWNQFKFLFLLWPRSHKGQAQGTNPEFKNEASRLLWKIWGACAWSSHYGWTVQTTTSSFPAIFFNEINNFGYLGCGTQGRNYVLQQCVWPLYSLIFAL